MPPSGACQDGERAPQGAHCCETRRSPPQREDGPDLPEGDRRVGQVDHLHADLELPAALHRAGPAGLGQPGQSRDAEAGGVAPAPGSRGRNPGAAKPATAEEDGAAAATASPATAGRPAPDAGSRARIRPPARRSARPRRGRPRRATAAGRGPEATGGAGPTPAAAAARRPAPRRRPRRVRASPRHHGSPLRISDLPGVVTALQVAPGPETCLRWHGGQGPFGMIMSLIFGFGSSAGVDLQLRQLPGGPAGVGGEGQLDVADAARRGR